MKILVLENLYKTVVLLFGAASHDAPYKGTTILKSFRSPLTVLNPPDKVQFVDFSRPLSDFLVLFKACLIFKNLSRQPCIFKYFSLKYQD